MLAEQDDTHGIVLGRQSRDSLEDQDDREAQAPHLGASSKPGKGKDWEKCIQRVAADQTQVAFFSWTGLPLEHATKAQQNIVTVLYVASNVC